MSKVTHDENFRIKYHQFLIYIPSDLGSLKSDEKSKVLPVLHMGCTLMTPVFTFAAQILALELPSKPSTLDCALVSTVLKLCH